MKKQRNRKRQERIITDPHMKQKAQEAIRNKYKNQCEDRIKHNKEIFQTNEMELKITKRNLEMSERIFKVKEEMENAKLSGLKVINPKFEYETTPTWQELQKELILIELETIKDKKESSLTMMKDSIVRLEEAQTRIIEENKAMEDKIKGIDENRFEFDNEEVPEEVFSDISSPKAG